MKKVMKKKAIFLLIGIVLLLTSLPISTKMVMELVHNQKMNAAYDITNVSKGFPPTASTFNFKDHIIEMEEKLKDQNTYIDPWSNRIGLADLTLKIDGKQIDSLKNYPIRVEKEGLNRYYGEVSYLTLENKKTNETEFIVLLKKTRELQKEMPNGDIAGGVPSEKLTYTLYTLGEAGQINNQSFNFTERDALKTELLNAGAMVPYSVGYYTDVWEGYPSIFFPLIFPFLTLIVGFLLIFFSLAYFFIRKEKKKIDELN